MSSDIEAFRIEPDQIYQTYREVAPEDVGKTCIASLRENIGIHVVKLDDEEMVFDLVGVDASLANALRRIILAEVTTMAIETVHMFANSSILHDELLAHRLGLVPIKADAYLFEELPPGADATEKNTLVFELDVAFAPTKREPGDTGSALTSPTMSVYSKELVWRPRGSQETVFADDPPRPVHDDILLAKLKPGQRIKVEGWCRKGNGRDHAKFSPVATASYRLLPRIRFTQELRGELADEAVSKCPMNVFDIEDLGKGERRARVARPRDCTMCRECIREGDWSDKIKLERVADHFIFSIETVGSMKPEAVLKEAVKLLREKANNFLTAVGEGGEPH